MKKILISFLVLIFTVQLLNAAEVCVVVDYGGVSETETDSKCISIDEGKNGYELLNKMGWNIEWGLESLFGHMLCKINGVGEDIDNSAPSNGKYCQWNVKYSESYWSLNVVENGDWVYQADKSFDGTPHYETKEGDVVGLAFGPFPSKLDMFKVNATRVYVDGEKQSESKTRSGKITDVFPESKVEFKIELENLYHSSTDISIKDISIEGAIEEIDDGADIEEDISEFDLDADRKTTKDLIFTIPLEVEAKDRLLRIDIGAKDDAGIKYDIELTYDLEIEKESHKLKIIKAELNKESYTCGENALLDLSILNIGTKDEDISLKIRNEDLEIDINNDFELSNDVYELSSRYNNKFNIQLPDNLDKVAYPVTITASYSGKEETNNVDLVISECEGAEEAEGSVDVQVGKPSKETEISESKGAELEEQTVREEGISNKLPLILAIVLVVFVVIIIGLFLMLWFIKKRV